MFVARYESDECIVVFCSLSQCGVTEEGCAALASVLRSNSHLSDLSLSENNLGDSGVKLLSAGLENPICKLEILT